MPLNYQVPRNLDVRLNSHSQVATLSKTVAKSLFALIISSAASSNYAQAEKDFFASWYALATVFSMNVDTGSEMKTLVRTSINFRADMSNYFNAINGFKEGLKVYPLNNKLNNVKPFKATLIRFMHSLLLSVAEVHEVILTGGRPDIDEFAQAFIRCGKKIEAMS